MNTRRGANVGLNFFNQQNTSYVQQPLAHVPTYHEPFYNQPVHDNLLYNQLAEAELVKINLTNVSGIGGGYVRSVNVNDSDLNMRINVRENGEGNISRRIVSGLDNERLENIISKSTTTISTTVTTTTTATISNQSDKKRYRDEVVLETNKRMKTKHDQFDNQDSSSESSDDYPQNVFHGPYKNNYHAFYKTIAKQNFSMSEFMTLGNVSSYPELYFNRNADHINKAVGFLQFLWDKQENIALIKNIISNKFDELNSRNSYKVKYVGPPCIGFVFIEINNKQYCLISNSTFNVDMAKKLNACLIEAVNQYNSSNQTKDIELVYFSVDNNFKNNINDFDTLISQFYGQDRLLQASKHCAEKISMNVLAKLFAEHGNNIQILGAVNYAFYPYPVNKQSSNQCDAYTRPPLNIASVTKVGDRFAIYEIPCCETCQKNKNIVLDILKTAQEKGEELINENTQLMSPIHTHMKTESSLLLEENQTKYFKK